MMSGIGTSRKWRLSRLVAAHGSKRTLFIVHALGAVAATEVFAETILEERDKLRRLKLGWRMTRV